MLELVWSTFLYKSFRKLTWLEIEADMKHLPLQLLDERVWVCECAESLGFRKNKPDITLAAHSSQTYLLRGFFDSLTGSIASREIHDNQALHHQNIHPTHPGCRQNTIFRPRFGMLKSCPFMLLLGFCNTSQSFGSWTIIRPLNLTTFWS